MRRVPGAIAGLAAALTLTACSLTQPSSPSTPKVDLTGGTWQVRNINGAAVGDEAKSTLQFGNDGRVSGRGGCNGYSGTVEISGASMIIGQLISTKMACAPPAMNQETDFLAALQATRSYRMDGMTLVLSDATGKSRLSLVRSP